MPRVRPVSSPWMISTSVPEMGFRVKSQDGAVYGFVDFLALFSPARAWKGEKDEYHHVAIVFENIVSLRMPPRFSESDRSRVDGYDWSAVPDVLDETGEYESRLNELDEQWEKTGVCPDPRAYVVDESDWLLHLGYTPDLPDRLRFEHYLLIGKDHYVEVIAKSWRWEIVGSNSEPAVADFSQVGR